MDTTSRQRLASQVSQGRVILFTGAGFSRAATSRAGEPLPLGSELAEKVWAIAFPGQPFERGSGLGEVFEVALRRNRIQLKEMLERCLRTDRKNLPDGYRVWFAMPWLRSYTLNMDDLAEACQVKFNLSRRVVPVSGLRGDLPTSTADLLSIHLNGRLSDFPEVTFSPRQYGERVAFPDPWYEFLVSDLVNHPIIHIRGNRSQRAVTLAACGRSPRADQKRVRTTPTLISCHSKPFASERGITSRLQCRMGSHDSGAVRDGHPGGPCGSR